MKNLMKLASCGNPAKFVWRESPLDAGREEIAKGVENANNVLDITEKSEKFMEDLGVKILDLGNGNILLALKSHVVVNGRKEDTGHRPAHTFPNLKSMTGFVHNGKIKLTGISKDGKKAYSIQINKDKITIEDGITVIKEIDSKNGKYSAENKVK